MYRTLAFAAALARSATGFAPAAAPRRSLALMAKYTDANGNPIKAALSAYMHFCNDERATVTAEQKRLAGDSFKQTLVMTKLGALWRELPEARKVESRVEINQRVHAIRRNYRVDGVGRPKFDFHTHRRPTTRRPRKIKLDTTPL